MPRQLGEAFVRVRPDASGFGKELGQEVTSGDVASGVEKSGSSIGSKFGKALKVGAIGVVGAAGAVLGVALTKGFQRLEAIDQARAKLEGLGHSAKAVNGIMTNALTAVKGTAFGLDEAATVAATSVAAGIKPGKQLEKTLRLVADAATIGGTSMADMGAIFNKVAASNKLQGDVIQQLNQQGIPIIQLLGKSLHKTSGQVLELSKQGKISFADFSKAMQQGLGGSALKSGDTFTGAWKNLMASLSRIGAGLLGGIFPHMAPAIENLTKAMGPLEDAAGKIGDKIGKVLGPALENAVPWISHMADNLTRIDFGKVASGSSSIGQGFRSVGDALKNVDWSQVKEAFGKSAGDTIKVTGVVIGFLADHLTLLAKALPFLIAGFAAFKAAQAAERVLAIASIPTRLAQTVSNIALARALNANTAALGIQNGVERVGMLTRIRSTAATVASRVATFAAAAASKAWAAAQWLLNAALTANPIGIVIAAIAALVAGIIIAYKKSETFRKIVQAAFHGVQVVASKVFDWLSKAVSSVVDFIKKHWRLLVSILGGPLVAAVLLVQKNWGKIKAVTSDAWNAVRRAIGNAWDGIRNTVSNGVDRVVSFVRSIPGKIASLGGQMLSAGRSFIGRLFDGILAGARSAGGFVASLVGSVKNAINSALHLPLQINLDKGPLHLHATVIPALAQGGIVRRPTLAMIGDNQNARTDPEVVAPLSKLRAILGESGHRDDRRPINFYGITDPSAVAREVIRHEAFAGVGG